MPPIISLYLYVYETFRFELHKYAAILDTPMFLRFSHAYVSARTLFRAIMFILQQQVDVSFEKHKGDRTNS